MIHYDITVKSKLFILLFCFFSGSLSSAESLPDLGDVNEEEFPLVKENALGAEIMRKVRSSNSYVADPEVSQYLNDLGYKLVSNSADPGRQFEFFLVKSESINAFALPGGYIGIHSGLILSSGSESELAGVIGHEVAHVQQRHIARMLADRKKLGVTSLAGLGLAILASRSSGQLAQAAVATSQAAPLQAMLSFSREHEREADRVGLKILSLAGFDSSAPIHFFDRLYRENRVYNKGIPGYLQTHPMTSERMADLQARLASMEPGLVENSLHYLLIKSRVSAITEDEGVALKKFDELMRRDNFLDQVAARYGRAVALLSVIFEGDNSKRKILENDLRWLESHFGSDALVLCVLAESKVRLGLISEALEMYDYALKLYPTRLALIKGKALALKALGDEVSLEQFLTEVFKNSIVVSDSSLYELRAGAYKALGLSSKYHFDLSRVAYLNGNLDAAIRELQAARDTDGGDYFLRSQIDASLKDLVQEKSKIEK
jgi:predicted Zn-dependent protease